MTTDLPPTVSRYRKPRRGKSLPPPVPLSPMLSPLSPKPIRLKQAAPSRVSLSRAPIRAPAPTRVREHVPEPVRIKPTDTNEKGQALVCVAIALMVIAIWLQIIDRWQELTWLDIFAR